MRILTIVLLLTLLASAGCSVMEPLPANNSADPNVGGGKNEPGAGGAPDSSGPDAGGGIAAPENRSPTSVRPGTSGAPQVDLPLVAPGGAVQQEDLTFTIDLLEITPDQVTLEYTVSGLPSEYEPLDAPIPPAILLTDGRLLMPIRDEGSGSPGSETVQAVFPAVPQGTDLFLLLIENRWSGSIETWRVPVNLES